MKTRPAITRLQTGALGLPVLHILTPISPLPVKQSVLMRYTFSEVLFHFNSIEGALGLDSSDLSSSADSVTLDLRETTKPLWISTS